MWDCPPKTAMNDTLWTKIRIWLRDCSDSSLHVLIEIRFHGVFIVRCIQTWDDVSWRIVEVWLWRCWWPHTLTHTDDSNVDMTFSLISALTGCLWSNLHGRRHVSRWMITWWVNSVVHFILRLCCSPCSQTLLLAMLSDSVLASIYHNYWLGVQDISYMVVHFIIHPTARYTLRLRCSLRSQALLSKNEMDVCFQLMTWFRRESGL